MRETRVPETVYGKFIVLLLAAAVVFFPGQSFAEKQTKGMLLETGCERILTPAELIKKNSSFDTGDCVYISNLDQLDKGWTPKQIVDLEIVYRWELVILRGYGKTPEEGCVTAKEFVAALNRLGWKTLIGFSYSCHTGYGSMGVEIFLWKSLK